MSCAVCGGPVDTPRIVCLPCLPAFQEAEDARYRLDPDAMFRDLLGFIGEALVGKKTDRATEVLAQVEIVQAMDRCGVELVGHEVDRETGKLNIHVKPKPDR